MNDFLLFFKLGFEHVLDLNGYDHLLFLTVLTSPFLPAHWKKLLWLVSIFTLGHTLSLVLSAFNILKPNPSVIEFFIPLTILITAIYNFFNVYRSQNRYDSLALLSAGFFGIIHGFGFSNYFVQLASFQDSIWQPLISFALGIELAQVLIVAVVVLLGFILLRYFRVKTPFRIAFVSLLATVLLIPILYNTWPF